jgi:hypothetical protein
MTKFTNPPRRTNKVPTKPAAKSTSVVSPARMGKKLIQNLLKTSPKKSKTNSNVIELHPKAAIIVKGNPELDSNTWLFGTTLNKSNEEVLLAPLTVDLTRLFLNIDHSYKQDVLGYEFQDRTLNATDDDKELDIALKRGTKMIYADDDPTFEDWHNLFVNVFADGVAALADGEDAIQMRDFSLNLAASDPLVLFAPEEWDQHGNLQKSRLAFAWLGATAAHGSVHFYFESDLQKNRLRLNKDMDIDEDDFEVPSSGAISEYWINVMPESEKCMIEPFTHSQRFQGTDGYLTTSDSIATHKRYLGTTGQKMSISQWTQAFDTSVDVSSEQVSSKESESFRFFGSNLAVTDPRELFQSTEWNTDSHLKPQPLARIWLGAVSAFGPLWLHRDAIGLDPVIPGENKVVSSAKSTVTASSAVAPPKKSAATPGVSTPAEIMEVDSDDEADADDDDADDDVTVQAGSEDLIQNKITGKDRKFQLRYDLKLVVEPSKDADKKLIAVAKKFFAKLKEADDSVVIYPWFKKATEPKIRKATSIPDSLGAFKKYFHQAQPKVAGGPTYMRIWLGHDKDPALLHEDINWWLKEQVFGLYQRSVQAENISSIGWLLYSTKEVDCKSLQRTLEAHFDNKFEVGCRYRMIQNGRRGPVPEDQRVNAIHIECDTEVQFELKVLLSKIYASDKNIWYPHGIRMRLVPEINSMISPDTRQNVTRLRTRQDNFQKQICSAVSWDISAIDFVDPVIGRSLRELIMSIESRQFPGQPLFHIVDLTWSKNGYNFLFFPNVESEARAMMMALLPFLVHHYKATASKWFTASAQSRALGAVWDPEKGCVKTIDDDAVSWMMTEPSFISFDISAEAEATLSARPDPTNLQTALIAATDSVGTFDPNASANIAAPAGQPAILFSGAMANPVPIPRVLPTGTDADSAGGKSDSSSLTGSITATIFSRFAQIEGSLAKVDRLDTMMNAIALKLGIVAPPTVAETATTVPPTPSIEIPQAHSPDTQLDQVAATPGVVSSPARTTPDDVRPSTHGGTSSTPGTLHEIRQSPAVKVNADASTTSVGRAG